MRKHTYTKPHHSNTRITNIFQHDVRSLIWFFFEDPCAHESCHTFPLVSGLLFFFVSIHLLILPLCPLLFLSPPVCLFFFLSLCLPSFLFWHVWITGDLLVYYVICNCKCKYVLRLLRLLFCSCPFSHSSRRLSLAPFFLLSLAPSFARALPLSLLPRDSDVEHTVAGLGHGLVGSGNIVSQLVIHQQWST